MVDVHIDLEEQRPIKGTKIGNQNIHFKLLVHGTVIILHQKDINAH